MLDFEILRFPIFTSNMPFLQSIFGRTLPFCAPMLFLFQNTCPFPENNLTSWNRILQRVRVALHELGHPSLAVLEQDSAKC